MQPGTVAAPKQTGFTLIELLVVVGMVTLLGMTLLPVLAKSGPNVSSDTCLNNTRQLGVAWRMYAEDSHDRLVFFRGKTKLDVLNLFSCSS